MEPWGEQRADLRQAITSAILVNANSDPKKTKKAAQPSDFMPFPEPEPPPEPAKEQPVEQAMDIFKRVNRAIETREAKRKKA